MIHLRRAWPALGRRAEWDGFLTLCTDNLAKIVILPAILMGAFHLAPEIVYGKILAGLGLTLLIGQMGFVYLAGRLARKTGRDDVTALPYGISTPAMFVYLFAIIGPVYFATGDPVLAYRVGLAAALIGGMVELAGALVGPAIQKIIPRAGMMGTMAGVALVWIAMVPTGIIFSDPLIGLPCVFVVLLGLAGGYRFPFRLPAGLVVLILGVGLGLLTRESSVRLDTISLHLPVPVIGDLWEGLLALRARPELLAVIVAIEIYNFMEGVANIESARTTGDNFDLRQNLVWNGLGTCVSALFGSPFPTAVYIGHPAYKRMGARRAYATLSGSFLCLASLTGVFALLQHLVPAASISALLVFIGLAMTQYAFQSVSPAHGIALALALVPHLADLLHKQLDGTLAEILPAGAVTPDLLARMAGNQGVYMQSYALLAHGAIITGLLWGSIVAFLVDGDLRRAILISGLAFVLSLTGLIHAEQIGLSLTPITYGYLVLTALLAAIYLPAWLRQLAVHGSVSNFAPNNAKSTFSDDSFCPPM